MSEVQAELMAGARIQFGSSPWARHALQADPDWALRLAHEAQRLRVNVSIVGKTEAGPWVIRVGRGTRSLRFAGAGVHDTVAFGLERWAAGASDDGVRWTAGSDGLSHAHASPRSVWTLCEEPARDERTAHPERHRCQACWRTLDRRTVAA